MNNIRRENERFQEDLRKNLDEMRKFCFQAKFLYLLETIKFSVAQDQDYLNRLCKGRVRIISNVWDKMPIENKKIMIEDIKQFLMKQYKNLEID